MYNQTYNQIKRKISKIVSILLVFVIGFNLLPQPGLNQNGELALRPAIQTTLAATTDSFSTPTSTATWMVPTGVTSVTVKAWGAGGGGGGGGDAGGPNGGDGAAGGYIRGTIAVTPGETLNIYVGGGGGAGNHVDGDGGSSGGGGGYSGVFRSSSPLFVAGAGGGGGGSSQTTAGEHGGKAGNGGGTSGTSGTGYGAGNGGSPGTLSSGGSGGSGTDFSGDNGSSLTGGAGKQSTNTGATTAGAAGLNGGGAGAIGSSANRAASGGGGAGYYGGGGGGSSASGSGGGGGGSSYATSTATATTTFSGSALIPPNNGDVDYVAGVGAGGAGLDGASGTNSATDGGDGLVVLSYTLPTGDTDLEGFRFRDDDGSESAASWLEDQDTDLVWGLNDPFRFRALVDVTGTSTTQAYELQYKATSSSDWRTVTDDGNFPVVEDTTTSEETTGTTNHTIDMPSGIIAGDLLLTLFSCDAAECQPQIADDSWNKMYEHHNSGILSGSWFWKIATSSFDSVVATTEYGAKSTHITLRISGAGAPTVATSEGNGTDTDPPSLTTSAARNYLWVAGRTGSDDTVATVAPSGYSGLLSIAGASGDASTDIAYKTSASNTENPGTFTSAYEVWLGWTVAVPPRETPPTGSVLSQYRDEPTGTDDTSYGSVSWSNPERVTDSDGSKAFKTMSGTTATYYLLSDTMGFSVPTEATIVGIQVAVEAQGSSGSGEAEDASVRLFKGGTVVGSDYANTTNWDGYQTVRMYGGENDLWGTTWTPDDINNSGFGFGYSAKGEASGSTKVVNVDHTAMTVFYTLPSDVVLAPSSNIVASGANTTAQLTAPSGKNTGDFDAGRIQDDENPSDSFTIDADDYTELEWSIMATGTATTGDAYDLRVVDGDGIALDSYSVSPQFEIGTYIAPSNSGITLSGTLYESNGSTPITTGKTIALAIGTSTPSVQTTTSDGSGNFSFDVATSSGASSWTVGSGSVSDGWRGVTYGNGLFVVVGDYDDRVMTSPDGINWTAHSAAGDNDSWNAVTYGNGQFVAVGAGSEYVMTSPDGINWTVRSAAGDNDDWNGVAYGNGTFVAVGQAGDRVMYSSDGVNWATTTAAGNNDFWYDVTYGNGLFVAVGAGGGSDYVMTSPDGINWTARTASGNAWYGVTYGNGRFVAVGGGGSNYVMTSTNGTSWSNVSAAGNNDDWRAVTYGNGLFVAVGDSDGAEDPVMYSADGLNWTAVSAAGDDDQWRSVTFGKNKFVGAVYSGSDRAIYSASGLGPNTPLTLFVDGDAIDATTFMMGVDEANVSGIPLIQNTVTAFNANTIAASSTTKLTEALFYDSTDDADILYTYSTTTKTLTISGSFNNEQGTTIAPYNLNVSGDFTDQATFSHNYGTTTLNGTSQTLDTTATTTFYNLTKSVASTDTITFGAGDEFVTRGTLTLTGAASNLLSLRSGTPDTAFYLRPWGTATVSYLDVQDSYNISATSTPIDCSVTCLDSGNNSGWTLTSLDVQNFSFSRVQSVYTDYMEDPASVTLSGTPTAGNLLIATAGERSGGSADNFTISGSGWTKILSETILPGDTSARHTHVMWYKVAGAGEPTTITVDDGTTEYKALVVEEFAADQAVNWSFLATTSSSTGSGSASPIVSDPTASLDAGDKLVIGNGLWRMEVLTTPSSVNFTGLSNVTNYDGSDIHGIALASAFASTTVSGTASTTLSWSGSGLEGSLGLAVFSAELSSSGITISGTLYESDGSTPITTGKTIALAIGTSTPSVQTTTSDGSGDFSFSVTGSTGGESWSSTGSMTGNSWRGLVYGKGLFVGVAEDGVSNQVVTSEDGITWTGRTAAETVNNGWKNLTYGGGTFVAVGNGNVLTDTVMTSPDGINWTSRSTSYDSEYWFDVAYANGRFVAVGRNGAVMYSDDLGETWTSATAAETNYWRSITYGEGLFVAVACGATTSCGSGSGELVMTSPDGINWTARTEAEYNTWVSVTYGNGRFVAVSRDGTNRVMYSDDGTSWSTASAAEANTWQGVEFVNGLFIATASDGTYRFMTSPDGENWTGRTAPGSDGWFTMAYGQGKFVALPGSGGTTGAYADGGLGPDTPMTVFADGEDVVASTITTGPSSGQNTISGIDLYEDTVRIQHASTTGSIDIGNADFYDYQDDVYISFEATTSSGYADFFDDVIVASNTTLVSSKYLDFEKNVTIDGSFEHEYGEVTFAVGNQTFDAAATTTFWNLIKQVTTSYTLTIGAGDTIEVLNYLQLQGTTTGNQFLSVRSTEPGTQWRIDPWNSFDIDTLIVQDSNNISATNTPIDCSATCYDGGNNTNWTLGGSQTYVLDDHTTGQVSNIFSYQNKTQEPLFAFEMSASTTNDTQIESTVLRLTGAYGGFSESSISNTKLYWDVNEDGDLDGGDVQIGGSGVIALSGQSGTITFSTAYYATSTKQYIVVGDTNTIQNGEAVTIRLYPADIRPATAVGVTGTVDSIQHTRGGYRGGGGGSTAQIGGAPPAGDGDVGGGGEGGGGEVGEEVEGENIVANPNFFKPSSNGDPDNNWTNPANAYDSDGVYATAATAVAQSYGGFGLSIPGSNTVTGVEVKVDASGSTAAGTIDVALSWDGGSSYSSTKATPVVSGSDIVYLVGGPADTWSHAWTPAEFGNTYFRVRVTAQPSSNTMRLDAIEVRVYHQAGGGGGGGGGGI